MNFKQSFFIFFTLLFIISTSLINSNTSSAASYTEVVYDDTGYDIITIDDVTNSNLNGISLLSTSSSNKTRSKSIKHYSSSDELCWIFTLTATFKYTGSSATCTSASGSVTVYDSSWSFVSKDIDKSGNKATGTVTMKSGTSKTTKIISLTCTKNGTVS